MPTSGGVVVPRVPTSGGLAGPRAPTSGKCAMQFFSSPCVFLNTTPANVGSLHLGRIPNCSEVPDVWQGGGSACADVWREVALACADVWFAAH